MTTHTPMQLTTICTLARTEVSSGFESLLNALDRLAIDLSLSRQQETVEIGRTLEALLEALGRAIRDEAITVTESERTVREERVDELEDALQLVNEERDTAREERDTAQSEAERLKAALERLGVHPDDPVADPVFVPAAPAATNDAQHEPLRRKIAVSLQGAGESPELRHRCEIARVRPGTEILAYGPAVRKIDHDRYGYGAARHARVFAELRAMHARANGVQSALWSDSGTFVVLVAVETALDLEILARKPPLPLAEQVRLCWSRAVNPRAFWPEIPPGYEEAMGIDFYGRRTP